MLKPELIKHVAERTGQSQRVVRDVLEATTAAVLSAVARGEPVMLMGLGKLSVQDDRSKRAKKTFTGNSFKVAVLRPSDLLADFANGNWTA